MNDVLEKIGDLGIVPMVKIEDAKDAVPLGKALIKGGLPLAEITFRTDEAKQAIQNITNELPEILVGAGTVLNLENARKAVDGGAEFIVTPGFDEQVVQYCLDNNIPVMPGCATPTDLQKALNFGLGVVKFFPAKDLGGVSMLKAMSGPFGMMKFIPTGGINANNLNEYLSFGKVHACGGSWIVKSDLIKEGKFDEITNLVGEAIDIMLGFELAHVGLNAEDAETSLKIAEKFASMFNMPVKMGNSSNYAGEGVEVNKKPGPGSHGHIAIKTNSIKRAVAYLDRKGINVDMSTAKYKGDDMVAVYLSEEVGGFAIHLLQKK